MIKTPELHDTITNDLLRDLSTIVFSWEKFSSQQNIDIRIATSVMIEKQFLTTFFSVFT